MNISYKDFLGDDFVIYDGGYRKNQPVEESLDFSARGLPDEEILEFLRIVLLIGLRIGYLLVQVGSVPVENIYIILYHNIAEIAASILSFSIIGMMIAVGFNSAQASQYWVEWKDKKQEIISDTAAGLSAVLTGTAQMSTFLAGRMHLGGTIVLTSVYCSVFQPLLMFLVWHQNFISGYKSCLSKESSRNMDFVFVVHIPSTLVGTIGALFLGRRLVKVRDIDEFSFGGENVILTTVGYILIILGYCTLNMPTQIQFLEKDIVIRLLSSATALSSGIAMVSLLYYVTYKEIYKYWMILRTLQGGIAGMITVSSAVTCIASLWVVILMAAVGATSFFFCALIVRNTALEDYCNMISSHLLCAFLGVLLWQIFSLNLNDVLLLIIVTAFAVAFAVIIFFGLIACGIFRNRYEVINHQRAVNVHHNLPEKRFLERLFMIDELKTPHILPGEFKKRFMPDGEYTGSRDKRTVTIMQNFKDKKSPKKKERNSNFTDPNSRLVKDEKLLLFPMSPVGGKKNLPAVGSGDHYDFIKI